MYEAWPAAKQPTSSRHERYDDVSRRSRKVRTCRRVAAWSSEGSARARREKRASPEGSCVNARATRTTAKCVFFFQRVRVVRLGPGPDPRDPRRPPVVHREGCVGGIEVASVRSLACGQATHLVSRLREARGRKGKAGRVDVTCENARATRTTPHLPEREGETVCVKRVQWAKSSLYGQATAGNAFVKGAHRLADPQSRSSTTPLPSHVSRSSSQSVHMTSMGWLSDRMMSPSMCALKDPVIGWIQF